MRERFRVGLPTAAACAALGAAGFVAAFNLVGQRSSDAATLSSEIDTASKLDPSSVLCHTPSLAARTSGMLRLAQRTEVPPTEMKAASPTPAFADIDPPLWDGLGPVSYKVTASGPAQAYFNQGLRLAFAFNHDEAQRAFRKAQKLDPECAMCFWGEALVLGPNINLPMQDEAVRPAFAAAEKAQALSGKATPREQALIEALSTRYATDAQGGSVGSRQGLRDRHG